MKKKRRKVDDDDDIVASGRGIISFPPSQIFDGLTENGSRWASLPSPFVLKISYGFSVTGAESGPEDSERW
ncbi:hypothetical protein RUM43_012306 [Polyplax serrata]|uniref:Uncharacterized protein n=1 Tax=Polyplax serrata TaxID=468196 RepID=A0AAN8NKG8_POLSC